MSILVSGIRELASTLGCAPHQAESVVREEQSARLAFARRGLFVAAGAVALGSVFSFESPIPPGWYEYPSVVEHWMDGRWVEVSRRMRRLPIPSTPFRIARGVIRLVPADSAFVSYGFSEFEGPPCRLFN